MCLRWAGITKANAPKHSLNSIVIKDMINLFIIIVKKNNIIIPHMYVLKDIVKIY